MDGGGSIPDWVVLLSLSPRPTAFWCHETFSLAVKLNIYLHLVSVLRKNLGSLPSWPGRKYMCLLFQNAVCPFFADVCNTDFIITVILSFIILWCTYIWKELYSLVPCISVKDEMLPYKKLENANVCWSQKPLLQKCMIIHLHVHHHYSQLSGL
jgi:hypothetical protein